jgi:hypothetical protein
MSGYVGPKGEVNQAQGAPTTGDVKVAKIATFSPYPPESGS